MSNVVEAILHFAGYLHVAQDVSLSHVFYDGGWHSAGVKMSETSNHKLSAHGAVGELDSLDSRAQSLTNSADILARLSIKPPVLTKADIHHVLLPHVHGAHVLVSPNMSPTNTSGAGSVASHQHHYSISYGEGGDQTFINVNQLNIEFNNNQFLAGTSSADGQALNSTGALNDMVHRGLDQIPHELTLPDPATTSLWDYIKAHDDAWAKTGSDGHDAPVADGRYHNGVADPIAAPAGSPSPPVLPNHGDSHPTGQVAELGGNTAKNVATVVDVNESAATKIVLGDFFQTNAIVQTNVLNDQSSVGQAGAQTPQSAIGHDHTDNIGSVIDKHGTPAPAAESADGLSVHVDTLNGDFFNIHALSQTNWLSNGNVVVQTEYEAYSKIVAGASEQLNIANVLSYGHHFDLVVIGGDYHEANLIYQTNVVLNQNNVKMLGDPGQNDGAGTDQTIDVGNNQLKNEASIEHDGTHRIDAVTSSVSSLAHELQKGAPVDESLLSNFAGDAHGALNVLLVTGSYYDLNVISQMNVISNSNLASDHVTGSVGHGFDQFVSAGGNVATNTAQIIQTGSSNQEIVGGSHYSDSLLIQANLVQSNHEPIVHSNTDALVNEAIAFISGPDTHHPSDNTTSLGAMQDQSHHQDLLGQVMA